MNETRKILPSWKPSALRENVRRPLFYVYLILPTLLGILGLLLLWMTVVEPRQANIAGRIISFYFASISLRATYKILIFQLTKKSWPAIILGGICVLHVAIVAGMYLSGENIDKETLQFGAGIATLGPILLMGGLFNWRMVSAPDNQTAMTLHND